MGGYMSNINGDRYVNSRLMRTGKALVVDWSCVYSVINIFCLKEMIR